MVASVDGLAARLAVEDTVVRMFVATDERDWPTLESCFTDPFTLDMTSMAGGKPATVTPHQVGNFRTSVTSSQAIVRCYGVAFHHRAKASGLKTRLFVGTYELALIPS